MKCTIFLILLTVTILSCNFSENLYGVHEPLTPYKLKIEIKKGAQKRILRKIDSLNQINSIACHHTSVKLEENLRVLCFDKPQCECYYLGVYSNKVIVYAVWLDRQKHSYWLFNKEEQDTSIYRVTERVKLFINSAEN